MTCNHPGLPETEDGLCILCWKERCEKAEACCAEKDEALKTAVVFNPGGANWFCYRCGTLVPNHSQSCQIGHALSSSCGQGFLPPDKARVLVEALLLYHEAWNGEEGDWRAAMNRASEAATKSLAEYRGEKDAQ